MKQSKLSSTVDRINFINCQIRYFRYQVPILERKQLADSISKLVKIEGEDGKIEFVVTF